MTEAQTAALARIKAVGTLYAYNGVSVATARALAARGLVTFTSHGVTSVVNHRTGRIRHTADWSVTAN